MCKASSRSGSNQIVAQRQNEEASTTAADAVEAFWRPPTPLICQTSTTNAFSSPPVLGMYRQHSGGIMLRLQLQQKVRRPIQATITSPKQGVSVESEATTIEETGSPPTARLPNHHRQHAQQHVYPIIKILSPPHTPAQIPPQNRLTLGYTTGSSFDSFGNPPSSGSSRLSQLNFLGPCP